MDCPSESVVYAWDPRLTVVFPGLGWEGSYLPLMKHRSVEGTLSSVVHWGMIDNDLPKEPVNYHQLFGKEGTFTC